MSDFLTKEIELCGVDMSDLDSDCVSEIIYDALRDKGVPVDSFSWSIDVEYMPQENDDE